MIRPYSAWRRAGLPVAVIGLAAVPLGHPQTVAPRPTAPAVLALRGVTVIDVTNGKRRADQTVVIVGNRIHTVGPARTTKVPADARVVEAQGKYLIPGLWDMHQHGVTLERGPDYLWNGLTGVRDAAMRYDNPIKEYRRALLTDTVMAPPRQVYFFTFYGTTAHDSASIREFVDSAKGWGFDFIKTFAAHKQFFFVIAAEARRMGLRFGGHLEDSVLTITEALDSGASIVDHISRTSGGLDRLCVHNAHPKYQTATLATCRQAAEQLRRHDAWWVLTIVDHGTGVHRYWRQPTSKSKLIPNARSERISAAEETRGESYCQSKPSVPSSGSTNWLRDSARFEPATAPDKPIDTTGTLSLMYRAGMPILAGSDRGIFSVHAELALMVSEGLSPLAALQTATLNPARFLHATDSLGTVAAGKLADLVLLEADPLVDITNTTTIAAVVANGRYFDRAALDQRSRGC